MTEGEYHGLRERLVERLGALGRGGALQPRRLPVRPRGERVRGVPLRGAPALPGFGPTAFLFFEYPLGSRTSPRNTLIGHLVAVLARALSPTIFGLLDHPSILQEGVTPTRVGAAALSVALTGQ